MLPLSDLFMKRIFTTCALLLLCFCWIAESAHAQSRSSNLVSKGGVKTNPRDWKRYTVRGEEYIRVQDLMNFYNFRHVSHYGRKGYTTYGAANRAISYRTGRSDFYVNNFRYVLSHPISSQGGQALISVVDVQKLVDPVLRPNFSKQASHITTVVLDPGHGGHDGGAVSAYAVEKTCNLQLARRIRDLLTGWGYKVVMTRDSDHFLTLQQRVDIANRTPNSIFVSIHHNSGRSQAEGIETFTLAPQGTTSPFARSRRNVHLQGNNQDSENVALATAIHSRTIKASGAVDRGIQRARFSVLCSIRRPAVLFEGGFVSNPREGRRIASSDYQARLATAIAQGIVAYGQIVGASKLRQTNRNRRY